MRDKYLVTFKNEEKKFKRLTEIVNEYKELNLQEYELRELMKISSSGKTRGRVRDRMLYLNSSIIVKKIIN